MRSCKKDKDIKEILILLREINQKVDYLIERRDEGGVARKITR